MKQTIQGLTQAEVVAQEALGHINVMPKTNLKSNKEIIFGHTFNLFNAYNVLIAIVLVAVQDYLSLFFLNVIVMNVAIRSFQEIRAKKMVEKLNILVSSSTKVLRDGQLQEIDNQKLVLNDVVYYESGNQISADAILIDGSLEMDESLLTGEAEPILRNTNEMVLSGSFVISGGCFAKVARVGLDNYAHKLTEEARQHKKVKSELMATFIKITNFCSYLVLPVGILLCVEAFLMRHEPLRVSVVNISAVLLGLLPKGLVLLTSLSFGISVFRLGKKRTLVQEPESIETLSRVDVLCIDKTGTLTKGEMTVGEVVYFEPSETVDALIKAHLANSRDNNATHLALLNHFGAVDIVTVGYNVPFSSVRKWAASTIDQQGTVYVGAPEMLIENFQLPEKVVQAQINGNRILMVAFSQQSLQEPMVLNDIKPLALLVIHDPIRHDVVETLKFFKENEVIVKVISGDHINTIAAVAKETGIENAEKYIDISHIESDDDLKRIALNYNVIGRASPYQKQKMIRLLQEAGLKVAMVGDGVNDVLALKTADCGIAMGNGSDAARSVSQVILLDNQFSTMVDVVMEGRLVTNNISQSASMYYLGTLITFLLAIVAITTNTAYPFIPFQMSLMSMFVEGMPSSFVTFESNYSKPKEKIMHQVSRYALPNGIAIMVTYLLLLLLRLPLPVTRTITYFMVTFQSFVLVYRLFYPMRLKHILVLCLSFASFTAACVVLWPQLKLAHLKPEEILWLIASMVVSLVVLWLASWIINGIIDRRQHKQRQRKRHLFKRK